MINEKGNEGYELIIAIKKIELNIIN